MCFGRGTALVAVVALGCILVCMGTATAAPPSFRTVKTAGEPGQGSLPWSEPRIAVGPDGKIWAVTNDDDEVGTAVVFGSSDGGKTFQKADAPLAGQTSPTPDVDIVVLPTG